MPKPEVHLFVCRQARQPGHPRGSCSQLGADGVAEAFAREIQTRQLFNRVALTSTGCLGPCQAGSNVLVYPGSHLYAGVKPEQVPRIVEEHLLCGEPVTEWLAPAEVW